MEFSTPARILPYDKPGTTIQTFSQRLKQIFSGDVFTKYRRSKKKVFRKEVEGGIGVIEGCPA